MAELPGWDRHRLETADPQDVEAARTLVYARAWAPAIAEDVDGEIENLEADLRHAEASKLTGDSHRLAMARETDRSIARLRSSIAGLRKAKAQQAAIREVLELDVDDDADPDAEVA